MKVSVDFFWSLISLSRIPVFEPTLAHCGLTDGDSWAESVEITGF